MKKTLTFHRKCEEMYSARKVHNSYFETISCCKSNFVLQLAFWGEAGMPSEEQRCPPRVLVFCHKVIHKVSYYEDFSAQVSDG